jgi:ABC-type transport system involved in multi-copper enzyme maturation permease subunit
MPLHDPGYKHWSGDWTTHPYRWWVVSRQRIRLLIKRKWFVFLMILSSIPFLVRAIFIYLSSSLGGYVTALRIDPLFFEKFLSQQGFFVFIISIYAGAGLISNDLRANALQIYFSKPITRRDYILGKLGALVFFLALQTLVPVVLLYVLSILFQASDGFAPAYLEVLGAILGYSLLIIFTSSLIMIGFSSLSKSSRFAGIGFAALFFFSQALSVILSSVLRDPSFGWVALENNIRRLGDVFFRTQSNYQFAPWISLLILAALMAAAVCTAYRRINAVEVVA